MAGEIELLPEGSASFLVGHDEVGLAVKFPTPPAPVTGASNVGGAAASLYIDRLSSFLRFRTLDFNASEFAVQQLSQTVKIDLSAVPWSKVNGRPTSISAYGITDAYTKTEIDAQNTAQNTALMPKTGGIFTGDITVSDSEPEIFMRETDGAAGRKLWSLTVNSGNWYLAPRGDNAEWSGAAIAIDGGTWVASFQNRPIFGGNLAWDAGNFDPASKANLSGNVGFTGGIVSAQQFRSQWIDLYHAAAGANLKFGRWQNTSGFSNFEVLNDAYSTVLRTPISINHSSGVLTLSARPVFGTATPWDSVNFDPATKASLTGAIFTGSVIARANASVGRVEMISGDATAPGYLAFFDETQTRVGYIGYEPATNKLGLWTESPFTGYRFNARPEFDGNTPWDTGNFDPTTKANLKTTSVIIPRGTTAGRPTTVAGESLFRYNTDLGTFEAWDGTKWGPISGGAYVGDTAPANPQNGTLWWKSDVGVMLIYYTDGSSNQWVAASPTQDPSIFLLKASNLSDLPDKAAARSNLGFTTNPVTGNLVKAWGLVTNNGTATLVNSFNVSSVSRTAAGQVRVNFTTPMTDANYAAIATSGASSQIVFSCATRTTGYAFFSSRNTSGFADTDQDFMFMIIG